MRVTHAVVMKVPNSLKFDEKKLIVNMEAMRKQQEDLTETLRESGVDVVELELENGAAANCLYAGDAAIMINGTALLCRPKKEGPRIEQISRLLTELSWDVQECPPNQNGKPVYLEASDVLYTGKEVFVGVRKNGTNIEGALVVGRIFCDLSVVPVMMSDKSLPLRYYVSIAAPNILAIGTSKEAQNILKRIEHEATFKYQTLTIDEDDAVNCLSLNKRVVFRQDKAQMKFTSLQAAGVELWALDVSELIKAGAPFSRYCLLLELIATPRR